MLGTKEIKEILPHRYPFLMIDRVEEVEEGKRAKEAGMDEHVAKPVDAELLIKVIHNLAGI